MERPHTATVTPQLRRATQETAEHAVPSVPVLLQSKLACPQVPPGYVTRPRLTNLLEAGSAKPLTMVSAGPGWGKTLATADWARSAAPPLAWVALDDADAEPRLFWSYVLSALRATGAVPADNALAELVPRQIVDDETIRRIADGLSRLPNTVVLVLDDLHEVSRSSVSDGIEFLRDRKHIFSPHARRQKALMAIAQGDLCKADLLFSRRGNVEAERCLMGGGLLSVRRRCGPW